MFRTAASHIPARRAGAPKGSHLGLVRFLSYSPSILRAVLATPRDSPASLRKRRMRDGDFLLFRWPDPVLRRRSLPVPVTFTRFATALFVFIFGID